MYFDRCSKTLKPLNEKENILIRENHAWVPGQVIEKHPSPRSYIVKNEFGGEYRRNRKFLRPSLNNPEFKNNETDFALEHQDNNKKGLSSNSDINDNNFDLSRSSEEGDPIVVRRSVREKRKPSYLNDYVQ